jgi:O-antigen/teichoic acid export membrane protein
VSGSKVWDSNTTASVVEPGTDGRRPLNANARAGLGGLGWNVVAAALPLIASFVVSLVLAPWFGERLFGIYFLAMTVATFALIPAKFGIQIATSRLLSEHEDHPGPWLRSGLVARLSLTLPTAGLLFALAPAIAGWLGAPEFESAFVWAAAVVVATSIFEFATESLVGLRAFRAQVATRLVALALRLGAVFAVRYGGYSVIVFLAAHSFAFLLPGLIALSVLLVRHRGAASLAGIRRTMEIAAPMALASASFLIYSHTDRLMLGWMHGPELVAQFGVARNVIDAALFPVIALTWSLRPGLVRAHRAGGPAAMRPLLREATRLALIYTFLAVALLAPIGDLLLPGLYDAEYSDAGLYFLGLLPVLALRATSIVVFPGLLAMDAQAHYSRLMTLTALVNLVLNFALIPRFGAWGATAATTVALAGLTIGGIRQIRALGGTGFVRDSIRSSLGAGAIALFGALVLILVRKQGLGWLPLLGIAFLWGATASIVLLMRDPPRLGGGGDTDPPDGA